MKKTDTKKYQCSITSTTRRNQLHDLPIYKLKYFVPEASFNWVYFIPYQAG